MAVQGKKVNAPRGVVKKSPRPIAPARVVAPVAAPAVRAPQVVTEPEALPKVRMKVRAKELIYGADNARHRIGDVFYLDNALVQFSAKSMEEVHEETEEQTTTAAVVLKQQRAEALRKLVTGERSPAFVPTRGDDDVI